MNWNDPNKENTIRDMIDREGLSAREVAERFGVTRNAVIGFCHRRGIELVPNTGHICPPPGSFVLVNDRPLTGSTPTPLEHTTGCRWPVEGGFCNDPVHNKSYCGRHYARAYRPADPVHPLLVLLATKGPQTPKTYAGCQAYSGLVRDRLVMFRRGPNGLSTFYLTENTPGY